MQRRTFSLLILATVACSCGGTDPERAVGWPRIHVKQSYRHHGDYEGWTMDPQGNYFTRSRGSPDGGSSTYTRCAGTVPPELVAPWFQKVQEWNTTPDKTKAPADDAPEFTEPEFEYLEAEGRPLFVADDAALQAQRDLAREVLKAMPESDPERCTKSDRF